MPFNSYPYFIFLAVAVIGFRLLEKNAVTARRVFLLLASYAFYAWWRADFLLLLAGSTAVNYLIGTALTTRRGQQRATRLPLFLGLLFHLGLWGFFKYPAMAVSTVDFLGGAHFPVPAIFLPLA